MMRDRHAVLRLGAQALTPVLLLSAAMGLARTSGGLGGPVASGLTLATALLLFALVFGFRALARVLPPLVLRALTALGLAMLLAQSVISPPAVEAWLPQAQALSPIEVRRALSEAGGGGMALLVACSVLQIAQAIGARVRPLEGASP